MFHKRTAWFSNSVERRDQKYWVSEGGHIVSWRTAEYLFSQDASNPDTQRIFASKDYQLRKVTVFHSLFLSACKKRESASSLCIGHYVLPPVCVQQEVRNVVGRLIWEVEDQGSSSKQLVMEDSRETTEFISSCEHLDTDASQNENTVCCDVQELLINTTGFISMNKLTRYSGELCELTPEHCCCSEFE